MQRLSLLFCLLSLVTADILYHNWTITWLENQNPDKLFPRRVIGVNGQWPFEPIITHVGDTLILNVTNHLDSFVSIHGHGLIFHNTTYYDGATMTSQCGIPVGASFVYRIPIQNWAGTYYFHAHSNGQYVDGLRTPHIILPPRNNSELENIVDVDLGNEINLTNLTNSTVPYRNGIDYDDDFVVALGDWYHHEHSVLIKQFLSEFNPTGAEPVPDHGLIYYYHGADLIPGFNDDAKIKFEAGKKYRLRIINMSAFAMWYVWLEDHDMKIIEIDGVEVTRHPAKVVDLSVSQRVSVLIKAKNTTSFNFKLHANMDIEMFDVSARPESLVVNYTSCVIYNETAPFYSPQPSDLFEGDEHYPLVSDVDLSPVYPEEILEEPYLNVSLNVFFGVLDDGANHGQFNNKTYLMAKMPTFLTVHSMKNHSLDAEIYGYNSNVYILKGGEVVQINLYNWDANSHPFHFHGHKFQIVSRSDDGSVDPEKNSIPFQENPMRRDAITVPSGGNVALRFRTVNPGTWLFHCHIQWHFESGLAVQFIEDPIAQQEFKVPQQILDQCKAQGIPVEGNGAGNMDPYDLNGQSGPVKQIEMGWTKRAIGALVGCTLSAILGLIAVVVYSMEYQAEIKVKKET
ncbi:ferroxidase, multicopper oxidase [Planoprotostelium fungivorum]|uniref:Ferroxidase, multicopper oxidase n=1 Tax=Planoprotostelium fungivorum TaxID=1890364 RepID=A0A2P6MUX3_9EUKA|nr:ferroxidase, multicopper oxidase [Planoprotostelium fungivorum]